MFVQIEYQKKYLKPVFGETKLMVDYILTHKNYNQRNQYYIICEIQGIKNCDLLLVPQSAEFMGSADETNEETLVEEAVIALFEESI